MKNLVDRYYAQPLVKRFAIQVAIAPLTIPVGVVLGLGMTIALDKAIELVDDAVFALKNRRN